LAVECQAISAIYGFSVFLRRIKSCQKQLNRRNVIFQPAVVFVTWSSYWFG